ARRPRAPGSGPARRFPAGGLGSDPRPQDLLQPSEAQGRAARDPLVRYRPGMALCDRGRCVRRSARGNLALDAVDIVRLTEGCVRIARAAGAIVMEVFHSEFAVRAKQDKSPVTDADERAETFIL